MSRSCAIGIDIGGTFTKVGLVSSDGKLSHLVRLPTASHEDPTGYLDRVRKLVSGLIKEGPVGIGLSLPGFHSPDGRSIQFNPNTPSLVGLDFVSAFERFNLPLAIEQDLNAPALAEHYFGAGVQSHRFMTAAIGTGAGVGVILDNRVLRFTGNSAGDTGHLILEPGGPTCAVGCHGCAEALVTIAAIEREARGRLSVPTNDLIWDLSTAEPITARKVIQAARTGDSLAVDIIRVIGRRIGQWLACLAPIFLPDQIVLCGGVIEAGEPLLNACRERFYQLTAQDYAHCEIVIGHFRELSGVVGAATPFLITTEK
jgi:glucokinase